MVTTADIDTKHQDVVVNGDTYKYVAAKAAVTTGTKADGNAAGWYKDGVVPADTGAGIVADADYADAAEFSTKVTSGTVKVGTTELSLIADKDNDGVDDNNKNVITKEKAYSLAAAELLKANQIGDTQNQAKVGIDKNYTAMTLANATNTIEIHTGTAKVANTLSFSLHVGADADMTNKITVDIDTMNSANLGIKGLNVTDKNGTAATYAIDAISDAISKVSSQRSALGAVQNRLEHTIDNLDNISENTSSAESRIRDTDMAKEMVNYSKNNILAQAGQSMLAQANQSTQGVLSLLQ